MKTAVLVSTSLVFMLGSVAHADSYYPSYPPVFSERIADDEWCIYQNEWYSHGAEVEMNGVKRVCVLENPYDRDFRRMIWKTKKELASDANKLTQRSKSGPKSLRIVPTSR